MKNTEKKPGSTARQQQEDTGYDRVNQKEAERHTCGGRAGVATQPRTNENVLIIEPAAGTSLLQQHKRISPLAGTLHRDPCKRKKTAQAADAGRTSQQHPRGECAVWQASSSGLLVSGVSIGGGRFSSSRRSLLLRTDARCRNVWL